MLLQPQFESLLFLTCSRMQIPHTISKVIFQKRVKSIQSPLEYLMPTSAYRIKFKFLKMASKTCHYWAHSDSTNFSSQPFAYSSFLMYNFLKFLKMVPQAYQYLGPHSYSSLSSPLINHIMKRVLHQQQLNMLVIPPGTPFPSLPFLSQFCSF